MPKGSWPPNERVQKKRKLTASMRKAARKHGLSSSLTEIKKRQSTDAHQ